MRRSLANAPQRVGAVQWKVAMKREADRTTRTSAHFGARRNARGARRDRYARSGNEAPLIAERAAMRHGNQDPKSERGGAVQATGSSSISCSSRRLHRRCR